MSSGFVNRALVVMALVAVTGSVAVGVAGAMPSRPASAPPAPTAFAYTGAEQTYTVPSGVVLAGIAAEGGHGGQYAEGGGREGGVGAEVPVRPRQTLYVEVGAQGAYNGGPVFGGGGRAGAPPPVVAMCSNGGPCADVYASSGGGASDVRTCSMSASSCPGGVNSAATRLIVGGGGGGESGDGNAPSQTCGATSSGGRANNFQYPPGNPSSGPVPILTSAGTVYPGLPTSDANAPGVTPAGGGSTTAGTGGRQAGCSNGSTGWTDSIAGSDAVGPVGGTGGDASSLGPRASNCSGNSCDDAGSGGGGGGGYFGGGGGATGLNQPTGSCGACNGAGYGQGGGGGASFVTSKASAPIDEEYLTGSGDGIVVIVPAVEIDDPVNGAVYAPGQLVHASWSCGYDGKTGLGLSSCNGTAPDGAAINTSPGTHTFTVMGTTTDANGKHAVAASISYRVRSSTTRTKSTRTSAAGYTFTVRVPNACVAPTRKLPVTLAQQGSSTSYHIASYTLYIDGVRKLKVSHAGSIGLSLQGLHSGKHTLKVIVLLRSIATSRTKTPTLTISFSVC